MSNQKRFKISPLVKKEKNEDGEWMYYLVDNYTGEVYWSSLMYPQNFRKELDEFDPEAYPESGISVDAAISYNPGGPFEYRGIDLSTGDEVFQFENFGKLRGTNNIAEFLAICHGIMYLESKNDGTNIIYSDSKVAITWVNKCYCNTDFFRDKKTMKMITDAEDYIKKTKFDFKLMFWSKKLWGEPPSDYGRK